MTPKSSLYSSLLNLILLFIKLSLKKVTWNRVNFKPPFYAIPEFPLQCNIKKAQHHELCTQVCLTQVGYLATMYFETFAMHGGLRVVLAETQWIVIQPCT